MTRIFPVLATAFLTLVTSCTSLEKSTPVSIGGCANPRNAPGDTELTHQHNDFRSFLHEHGISCTSGGSIGVTFNVQSSQYDEARRLIMTAMLEQPNRWSRLRLNLARS